MAQRFADWFARAAGKRNFATPHLGSRVRLHEMENAWGT